MIRRLFQAAGLLTFLGLLWRAGGQGGPDAGKTLAYYLGLDPLAPLVVFLSAGWDWIPWLAPGLAVLLLTIVGGRWFCAWICPLGATQDFTDNLPGRKPSSLKTGSAFLGKARGLKYIFLLLLIITALMGFSLLAWGSPLALAGRLYGLVLGAGAGWLGREFLTFISPWALELNFTGLAFAEIKSPQYQGFWAIALFLAVILSLGRLTPRFWCRYLCPAGAWLALLGRRSLLRRRVNEACMDCGRCARHCPMGALDQDHRRALQGECISCRTCVQHCPVRAISFLPPGRPQETPAFSSPRRIFILGGLTGAGAALSWRLDWNQSGHPANSGGQLLPAEFLRPPGAVSENKFLRLCLRCGACQSVCPTNMLQPAGLQGGWSALWTPVAAPRRGPCQVDCQACGLSCPTGALRTLNPQEKIWAKTGTALILRHRCLAWDNQRKCLVCDEACPYDAIQLIPGPQPDLPLPIVLAHKCTGCGFCERNCPVEITAIKVEPLGALRLDEGSWEEQGRLRGLDLSLPQQPAPAAASPEDLPPGFAPGFEEAP